MKRLRNILQVNTTDEGGGAEKITYNLHCIYRKKGYTAGLIVGNKRTDDPTVFAIPKKSNSLWMRLCFISSCLFLPLVGKIRGVEWLRQRLQDIGQPKKSWEIYKGHEHFEFPESWRIFDTFAKKPDIIHCHNLHGDYFDLRLLP